MSQPVSHAWRPPVQLECIRCHADVAVAEISDEGYCQLCHMEVIEDGLLDCDRCGETLEGPEISDAPEEILCEICQAEVGD